MLITIGTHAIALLVGVVGGWLLYRKYGVKAELVRVQIKDAVK
jgi:hypothetical protein